MRRYRDPERSERDSLSRYSERERRDDHRGGGSDYGSRGYGGGDGGAHGGGHGGGYGGGRGGYDGPPTSFAARGSGYGGQGGHPNGFSGKDDDFGIVAKDMADL